MRTLKDVKKGEKIFYLATLEDVFGYGIQGCAGSPRKARELVKKEYMKHYKARNDGRRPCDDGTSFEWRWEENGGRIQILWEGMSCLEGCGEMVDWVDEGRR